MRPTPARLLVAAALLFLALLPPLAAWTDEPFYLLMFRRTMILAMAALSLNLLMGFGGLVNFGHAALVGLGAYAVGVAAQHGVDSALIQWPIAILAGALYALLSGALSLRTRGVYFIMITLAFGQMLFFFFMSLEKYGGDDGLTLMTRSQLPALSLSNDTSFYYLVFALLLLYLGAGAALVRSRFGAVIRGARSNETRMLAIGFPVFRYQLCAFVIAGAMAGLAGALLANHTDFVSPVMMHWTRSADLIFMVLLGGTGSLAGPLIGAIGFQVLEEVLGDATVHWKLLFGLLLVATVLFARGGLMGAFERRGRHVG